MPSALVLYQFFYPDDVVSSVLLSELATGLVQRGWTVTALPCNRSWNNEQKSYPVRETHEGVAIKRIWRPSFPQSKSWGRLANCAWMLAAWSLAALRHKPDVVVVGSDPMLSASIALAWRVLRPKAKLVHWCFDLYPEAALADGMLKPGRLLSFFRGLMKMAYCRLHLIADIGSCMRERLAAYGSPAESMTLPPWAQTEPAAPLAIDAAERQALFGDARLALLYSGSFGRAHSFAELLTLARALRGSDARVAFSIRGHRAAEVQAAVTVDDTNITFAGFAPSNRLDARLSAPDIHVVSLRPEWTGTVVPSKFFGALAAGRPVLFIGAAESYLARVIREQRVGWVCAPGTEQAVADELRALAAQPEQLEALRAHCHRVYQECFRRSLLLDRFDFALRRLTGEPAVNHKVRRASNPAHLASPESSS